MLENAWICAVIPLCEHPCHWSNNALRGYTTTLHLGSALCLLASGLQIRVNLDAAATSCSPDRFAAPAHEGIAWQGLLMVIEGHATCKYGHM